jgi:BirA family biotin operon repressor/biotin-[acetyl-CoA-carboxylase] ligase
MLTAYTQFGKNHLHFDVLDSTNTFAQNLIAKSSPMDGTVISAGFQSQGRGQFDRKWHVEPR